MTVADYKKAWVEARMKELLDRGIIPAEVARRMEISQAWLTEALGKPTIGDAIITKMCDAFGFDFAPTAGLGQDQSLALTDIGVPRPIPQGMILVPKEEWDELMTNSKTVTRLLNAVLDHLEKPGA